MGDFIKELNIIDFLGMMLPGSLLILLFSMGNISISAVYTSYFGDSCSEGVKITILLIGGYIIGMLVHELGDQIEKQLWKIRCFDPKTYAAKVVGVDLIYNRLNDVRSNENTNIESVNSRNTFLKKHSIKQIVGLVLFCAILSSFLIFVYLKVEWIKFFNWFLCFCIILLISVIVIHIDCSIENSSRVKIDCVRQLNPVIQSRLVNKGNYQKRQVFDGFHVIMRNMIIVISVTEIYAYFFSETNSKLYELLQNFSRFGPATFIVFLLMFVRYYHYSYLKYKYSFENYLSLPSRLRFYF